MLTISTSPLPCRIVYGATVEEPVAPVWHDWQTNSCVVPNDSGNGEAARQSVDMIDMHAYIYTYTLLCEAHEAKLCNEQTA